MRVSHVADNQLKVSKMIFPPAEIMDAVKNTLFPGAGGTDSTAADGVPWWMKYVAKALAILSAVGQSQPASQQLQH